MLFDSTDHAITKEEGLAVQYPVHAVEVIGQPREDYSTFNKIILDPGDVRKIQINCNHITVSYFNY